jgi:hypothetical protein
MKNWICVIPTIREEQFQEFLKSFKPLFDTHLHTLIVVEDNPRKTFKIEKQEGFNIQHYSWKEIDKELGTDSWIIPRRTDCIRSFGFLKAYQLNQPNILTLDDDVRYNGADIFEAYNLGFSLKYNSSPFFDTAIVGGNIFMRGYPFKYRNTSPVLIQWGMWEGVPDLDGITQLQYPITDYKIPQFAKERIVSIPKGAHLTGCIMNCAFKREVTPSMYQLLMGQDSKGNKWPYDRWGDIWSAHIAKKYVEEALKGTCVINYKANIKHARASNVYKNIEKEASGYPINEVFVENLYIHSPNLFGPIEVSKPYFEAMIIWKRLLK